MRFLRVSVPKAKPDPLLLQIRNIKTSGAVLVRCLECEAHNVLANKICGRCGSSLPRLMDEDGRPRKFQTAPAPSKTSAAQKQLTWRVIIIMCLLGFALIYRACAP